MSRPIEGIELGEAVEEDFDGVVGKHVLENAGIDVVEGDVAEFALMSQIDDQISAGACGIEHFHFARGHGIEIG